MTKDVKQFRFGIFILILLSLLGLGGCQKPADGLKSLRLVQVSEATGDVQIKREKQTEGFSAVKGMNLNVTDTLRTASQSYATLNIDNEQTIDVWEEVDLDISELLSKSELLKGTKLNLQNGKLYIRIKKALNPGESFEITTPNCIMGVRGTEFFVSTDGSYTELAVLHGTVTIALLSEPTKTQAVEVDHRVLIGPEVKSISDVAILPLLPDDLDPMIIEEINQQPENINPVYFENQEATGDTTITNPGDGKEKYLWEGNWDTEYGVLTIEQEGAQVTGNYSREGGKIVGTISGNVLRGTWSESPTYLPPKDAGDIEFIMSADGLKFEGRWRYASEGDWQPWAGYSRLTDVIPVEQ